MAAAFLSPAMLAAWLFAGLQAATPITTAAASGTTGADTMTSQTSDEHRDESQAGQAGASSSATASASAHARSGSSGDCIAESRASAEAFADGEGHTDQDSDREVARGDDCQAHAQSRASARTGGGDADGGTAE